MTLQEFMLFCLNNDLGFEIKNHPTKVDVQVVTCFRTTHMGMRIRKEMTITSEFLTMKDTKGVDATIMRMMVEVKGGKLINS